MSVAVVMATYNGARHLAEQLDSILAGRLLPDLILARDDGSQDGTWAILEAARAAHPALVRLERGGARLGAAGNFLHLIRALPDAVQFAALADQDDVWERDKLARAVAALHAAGTTQPTLYCSRQRLVDEEGRLLRLSPDWRRPLTFRNALVENIVTGCTAVLNRAAIDLVRRHPLPDVPFHDWWLYLAVTGVGGRVIYDPRPSLRYRQHGANVTGGVVSWRDDIGRRVGRLKTGASRAVLRANMSALAASGLSLTDENRELLDAFGRCFEDGFSKPARFFSLRLYRQRPLDTAILHLMALARRL